MHVILRTVPKYSTNAKSFIAYNPRSRQFGNINFIFLDPTHEQGTWFLLTMLTNNLLLRITNKFYGAKSTLIRVPELEDEQIITN